MTPERRAYWTSVLWDAAIVQILVSAVTFLARITPIGRMSHAVLLPSVGLIVGFAIAAVRANPWSWKRQGLVMVAAWIFGFSRIPASSMGLATVLSALLFVALATAIGTLVGLPFRALRGRPQPPPTP